MEQNYPNPFNPQTTIQYKIPEKSVITINVYNVLGELIEELIDQPHEAGVHELEFDASNLGSGVYFYSMNARTFDGSRSSFDVKKMMLIK